MPLMVTERGLQSTARGPWALNQERGPCVYVSRRGGASVGASQGVQEGAGECAVPGLREESAPGRGRSPRVAEGPPAIWSTSPG